MTAVHVATVNNSDQKATLLLDDERDAERIEYLQKLAKKDKLASVKVSKAPTGKSTSPAPTES